MISCKSSPSSSTRPSRSSSSTTGTLNVDTGLEMRSREQIFKPGGRKAGKRRRGGRGLRSIRRIRVTPESNNTFCRLSALREVGSPFGLPSSPTEEAFLRFVSSASMLFDRTCFFSVHLVFCKVDTSYPYSKKPLMISLSPLFGVRPTSSMPTRPEGRVVTPSRPSLFSLS